jgi:ribonuclease BN (tRNA processing enzyme)
VLLFFDHERYLFNCGEGLQRHMTNHRIGMTKIDHILATRVCTSTMSGLPGMLLSTKGLNPSSANLIGKENPAKVYGERHGPMPPAGSDSSGSCETAAVLPSPADAPPLPCQQHPMLAARVAACLARNSREPTIMLSDTPHSAPHHQHSKTRLRPWTL